MDIDCLDSECVLDIGIDDDILVHISRVGRKGGGVGFYYKEKSFE